MDKGTSGGEAEIRLGEIENKLRTEDRSSDWLFQMMRSGPKAVARIMDALTSVRETRETLQAGSSSPGRTENGTLAEHFAERFIKAVENTAEAVKSIAEAVESIAESQRRIAEAGERTAEIQAGALAFQRQMYTMLSWILVLAEQKGLNTKNLRALLPPQDDQTPKG